MNKNKIVLSMIPACFVLVALVMVIFIGRHTTHVSTENGTYGRFNSCVLLIPTNERTQEKIDKCWNMVQKETGVTVERFDVN